MTSEPTVPSRPDALLIRTKLAPPVLLADLVDRPRLFQQLDAASTHRLALLSAPPGFGKTTLVAQWLERQGEPFAWLSLDRFDRSPERVVRYLVAAVEFATSHRLHETEALLAARVAPPFDHLCEVFVSELAALDHRLIIALDDYHSVASEPVHGLIERVVMALPAYLHLVVLTRRDPPWPLGHWRGRGWLVELRGRDLRFSLEEARSFFAAGAPELLSDTAVQGLLARAEGWAAGLRMMLLSLRDAPHPEERARAFSGRDRLVVDYLMTEVLAAQPREILEFLTATAPLPRFCASLCDHLLEGDSTRPPAREILARLEQNNLFLVSLDNEGEWYRYHHLFQDLLLHHLPDLAQPGRRDEIGRRAGEWFAREGAIEEALRHWIDAGELEISSARTCAPRSTRTCPDVCSPSGSTSFPRGPSTDGFRSWSRTPTAGASAGTFPP